MAINLGGGLGYPLLGDLNERVYQHHLQEQQKQFEAWALQAYQNYTPVFPSKSEELDKPEGTALEERISVSYELWKKQQAQTKTLQQYIKALMWIALGELLALLGVLVHG